MCEREVSAGRRRAGAGGAERARASQPAEAVSDGSRGAGGAGWGAPGTTHGSGGFRAGVGSCASVAGRCVPTGSSLFAAPFPGARGSPRRREAKVGSAAAFQSPAPNPRSPRIPAPVPSPALCRSAVWSPKGTAGQACGSHSRRGGEPRRSAWAPLASLPGASPQSVISVSLPLTPCPQSLSSAPGSGEKTPGIHVSASPAHQPPGVAPGGSPESQPRRRKPRGQTPCGGPPRRGLGAEAVRPGLSFVLPG